MTLMMNKSASRTLFEKKSDHTFFARTFREKESARGGRSEKERRRECWSKVRTKSARRKCEAWWECRVRPRRGRDGEKEREREKNARTRALEAFSDRAVL